MPTIGKSKDRQIYRCGGWCIGGAWEVTASEERGFCGGDKNVKLGHDTVCTIL